MKTIALTLVFLFTFALGCDQPPLSEDEDMNNRRLGTGVNPGMMGGASVPVLPAPAAAVGFPGQGQLTTLLQFRPPNVTSQNGQEQNIAPEMIVATVVGQGGSGPLVGVARWGSGRGGMFQMEFDIPMPGFSGSAVPNLGGTLFAVPGESLEISARNDANQKTRAQDSPLGDVTQGIPQAYAAIGLGNRKSSQLTKTVFGVYNQVGISPGGGLVDTDFVGIVIPPFAVSFQVFRSHGSGANSAHVAYLVEDTLAAQIDGPVDLASGVVSPIVPLPTTAARVLLINRDGGGGAGTIQVIGAVFNLSP